MVLCRFWSKNWRCKEGTECRFAHGNAEMGRSQGVVDDRGFFRDEDIRAPRPLLHELKTEGSSIPVGYSKWSSHKNEDGKWEWSVWNGAGSSGDTVRHVLPLPPPPPMLPPEPDMVPPTTPPELLSPRTVLLPRQPDMAPPMTPPELLAPRTPVKNEPSSPRTSEFSDYDYQPARKVKIEPSSPSSSLDSADFASEASFKTVRDATEEEPLPWTAWGRWTTPEEAREGAELDRQMEVEVARHAEVMDELCLRNQMLLGGARLRS